jgi:CheY-like chemotaxis protein
MAHTILVIDDDEMALLVRKLVLEGERYIVLAATNTSEGLQVFALHPEIDLVITDHLRLIGSGIDVAAEVRRLSPNLPVMILSGGHVTPENVQPPDYFLHKLDGPQEMLGKVRFAIRPVTRT